jgi:hypothetical protein
MVSADRQRTELERHACRVEAESQVFFSFPLLRGRDGEGVC